MKELNLESGIYLCQKRIGDYENSEKIEVRNNEVRCMYRFNQCFCVKEKGLSCLVAKQARDAFVLKNPIEQNSPKCTPSFKPELCGDCRRHEKTC